MTTIEEKRVFSEQSGRETLLVASGLGLATVGVSADVIGEFSLARRCTARDVVAGGGTVAVATDDDLLVGSPDDFAGGPKDLGGTPDGLAETGFGPAVAVGVDGAGLLAADPDGRVARLEDGDPDREWTDMGVTDGPVRAIDGGLVASEAGVYRAADSLQHAGLAAVRDVAAAGVPHAATADGLYQLGNGWMAVRDGDFRVVAADPATAEPGKPGRAHAATRDSLFAHCDGDWQPVDLPSEEPVAGVAYGPAAYVVTEPGTLLVDAGDGWRSRSLGLPDVGGLAVV